MGDPPKLQRRPEVRAFSVEALLQLAQDGKLRIPPFQRPQRWRTPHVISLFDSVARGFPIGSLLLSRRQAPAATVRFGPVVRDAPAVDAYDIVDGQQRITALVGALLHSDPCPRGDTHAIWYDLVAERFIRLSQGDPQLGWVPLNVVGDSYKLITWLNTWPLQREQPALIKRAIAIGKAIREYQMSASIVEDVDEPTLRLLFTRVNTSGVPMQESEVFDALFGREGPPVQLAVARLSEVGFGTLSEEDFVGAFKAVAGLDPRYRFSAPNQGVPVDQSAVDATESALRRALRFLVGSAGIPHRTLLPRDGALPVLARFFHLHPILEPRVEQLLVRWVWRDALVEEVPTRPLLSVMSAEQAASVAALLSFTHGPHVFPTLAQYWLDWSPQARLCGIGLFSFAPMNPDTGTSVTVEELQARLDAGGLGGTFSSAPGIEGLPVGATRFLASKDSLERLLSGNDAGDEETRAGHGLEPSVMDAWRAGDIELFLQRRAAVLDPKLHRFFRERAGLDDSDRPSIAAIVARAGAEAAAK